MKDDVLIYQGKTDSLLIEVVLPRDVIMCTDVNWNESSHGSALCYVYDDIVGAVYEASRSTRTDKK